MTVKEAVKIKYPTWKMRGFPTPYEKLIICDKCGWSEWTTAGWPPVIYCKNKVGSQPTHGRMREATEAEYVAGKAALKRVIGGYA